MVLVAWVRRVIGLDEKGKHNAALAPSSWEAVAEGEDREALEEHCRMRFPGREYVVLRAGEAPVLPRGKG